MAASGADNRRLPDGELHRRLVLGRTHCHVDLHHHPWPIERLHSKAARRKLRELDLELDRPLREPVLPLRQTGAHHQRNAGLVRHLDGLLGHCDHGLSRPHARHRFSHLPSHQQRWPDNPRD